MIREAFQYVKQVRYALSAREATKSGDIFLEEEKENNFVLELVIYVWGKKDIRKLSFKISVERGKR